MSIKELLGKVLSQIGIFVVSAFLAGILLLAIQADNFQNDNEDLPVYENNTENVSEQSIPNEEITIIETSALTEKQEYKNETNIKHNLPKNTNTSPAKVSSAKSSPTKTYDSKKEHNVSKQKSYVNQSNSEYIYSAVEINHSSLNKESFIVSAAFGISPLFFAGQSFIKDYFQTNYCIFTPCCTLGITFPQKNNFTYTLYLSASSSSLNFRAPTVYKNLNMDFSSTLLLVKINFSIQRNIFSEKNLLEAHIGTGLNIFSKPVCTINELSFYRNNAVYPSLDFGLTFKHFFSNRFFAAMVCNISCQFPSSDKIIIVQPALTAGLTL